MRPSSTKWTAVTACIAGILPPNPVRTRRSSSHERKSRPVPDLFAHEMSSYGVLRETVAGFSLMR